MKMKTLGKLAAAMILTYAITDASDDNISKELASNIDKNVKVVNTYASMGNALTAYFLNSFTGVKKEIEKKELEIKKPTPKPLTTLKDYLKEDFLKFTRQRYENLIQKPENKETLEQITNKKIPILMFHKVGYQGDRYSVTPNDFKEILENLHENNYYALSFEEFVNNDLSNVPIGKRPYLITFDDAHPTQFQFIKGTNIPTKDCAVGVMEEFFKENKNAGKGAVFYQSAYGVDKEFIYIFGDMKTAKEKQDYLLNKGYDIGSHTTTHTNLAKANYKKVLEEINTIDAILEKETTSEYLEETKKQNKRSLALPYGGRTNKKRISKDERIDDFLEDNYDTILNATGGRTYLAKTKNFDPYSINRIEANPNEVRHIIRNNKEQFVQTKDTKEFFEKVYNFNPAISIDANEIEIKALANKF